MRRRLMEEALRRRVWWGAAVLLTWAEAGLMAAQALVAAHIVGGVLLHTLPWSGMKPLFIDLAALVLARVAVRGAGEVAAGRLAMEVKLDLRCRLFRHLAGLGPAFLSRVEAGDIVSGAMEGIESLETYFGRYLPQAALAVLVPFTMIAVIASEDFLSAVILALAAPLVPLFMILLGKAAKAASERQWNVLCRLTAKMLDTIQGLTTLKLFSRSREQLAALRRVNDLYRERTMATLRVAFLSSFALEFLATLSTALVAVSLGLRLISGHLHFEAAFAVLLLTPELFAPLRALGVLYHAGENGIAAAEQIYRWLTLKPEVDGSSGSPKDSAAAISPSPEQVLSVRQLLYVPPESTEAILSGVELTLKQGEVVALIGESGSGKSTLLELIMGLRPLNSGQVTLHGHIRTSGSPPQTWQSLIAYVPQMPYLFAGTVMENVRLARPRAEVEDVWKALEIAGAGTFVRNLPEGLATRLGEGGAGLSHGERQRIGIARAILKDAPLVLLDEPTANVDAGSDRVIREALAAWLPGRAALIATHRPSLLELAHRVVRLQDGELHEVRRTRTNVEPGVRHA